MTGTAQSPSGKPSPLVEVQLALGQAALDRNHPSSALEWFKIAARSGEARAYNMLGRAFELGWGTAQQPERAACYYRWAAERGDAWGMFNLADLLLRGEGVERDEAQALDLYVRAASLGHAKAMNMIGLFFEDGRLVQADKALAWDFFRAGADAGDCWAAFNCARLLIGSGEVEAALPYLDAALETGFPAFWSEMRNALGEASVDPRLDDFVERLKQRLEALP